MIRRSRWRRRKAAEQEEEHDEDDDVENEEDQSGWTKVTVNYVSTLHPPPKILCWKYF